MSNFTRIDLSTLPLPNVVEALDFEFLLQQVKAELLAKDDNLAPALELESEPLTKLLQVFAYRELLQINRVNQTAKSLLLAYATGSLLDHIGVTRDVERLIIEPADPNATPPKAAIYETDEAYRRRIQLAPERYSAGSRGAYLYAALSADGEVRDASVITPRAGQVEIWLQSHLANTANPTLLTAVAEALDANSVRPFTDLVSLHAATPFDFVLSAELTLFPGPDAQVVQASAQTALAKYLEQSSYIGYDVTISGLHAALHQAGVQRVHLLEPVDDLVIPPTRYARCTAQNISVVEYRDV